MSKTKRFQVWRYFRPFSTSVQLLLTAVFLAAFYLVIAGEIESAELAYGTLALLFLIVFTIWWNRYPSDVQLDIWLDEDQRRLHAHALSVNNIVEEDTIRPTSTHYGLAKLANTPHAKSRGRRGRDRIIRYPAASIVKLYYTGDKLAYYECIIDRGTGKLFKEDTGWHFYKDFTSASTSKEERRKKRSCFRQYTYNVETITLMAKSGHKIELTLPGQVILKDSVDGFESLSKGRQIVTTIRDILHEREAQPTDKAS